MQHLGETQIVDAVEGRLGTEAAAHLAACDSCGRRVLDLRTVVRTLSETDVPEPSPLFWEHFPARVTRAIETSPAPRPWFTAARLAWGGGIAAVLVAVVLLLPGRTGPAAPFPENSAVGTPPRSAPVEPLEDDIEADDAWALVRSVAEDLEYDDARAAGLAPRAGAIETAAMEMSEGERAELARLIDQELKRTGA